MVERLTSGFSKHYVDPMHCRELNTGGALTFWPSDTEDWLVAAFDCGANPFCKCSSANERILRLQTALLRTIIQTRKNKDD